MEDDNGSIAPVPDVPAAPSDTAKIQCISPLRPWARVLSDRGETLRPLEQDEIVIVPRDSDFAKMKRNRHVVEVA